jgi:hypothetical protein
MDLINWAHRWAIPQQAIDELLNLSGIEQQQTAPLPLSEAATQNNCRLDASNNYGAQLWRNNVGVLYDDRGVPVRFGLANESQKMNKKIKSSDLIGIRPIVIMQGHVGQTIGQFVARECKRSIWTYKGSDHDAAQLRFITAINNLGGDAKFSTGEF